VMGCGERGERRVPSLFQVSNSSPTKKVYI